MPRAEDWKEEWKWFLETVEGLVNQTAPAETGFPVETGTEPPGVAEITNRIVGDLTEETALEAVTNEFDELDARIQQYLFEELRLFNAAASEGSDTGSLSNKSVTEQLTKSTTVKDSVRSILPLPKWIDQSLEVLDEILDLVT